MATAVGIEGRTVRRNAPTIYNVGYAERLFHDAREDRLEQQIWGPLLAANEMGNPSVGYVLATLRALPDYRGRFEAAFDGQGPTMETVGAALAGYQRTLVSGASPFDRWRWGGEPEALSAAARRGFALFTGAAGCAGCHRVGEANALFTDHGLHNTGVGFRASMGLAPPPRRIEVAPGTFLAVDPAVIAAASEPLPSDLGRYEVSGDPADRWKYRTPTLRNVALTAPYMHDGSMATLHEVVAFYAGGGVANEGLAPRIRPLDLPDGGIDDLVAFLASLTGGDVAALVADALAAPVGDPG
jgi:cytochrome c peroxidase